MRRFDLREIEDRRVVDDDECFHSALTVDASRRAGSRRRLDPKCVDGIFAEGPAAGRDLKPVLTLGEPCCEPPPGVVVRARLAVRGAAPVVPPVVLVAAIQGTLI